MEQRCSLLATEEQTVFIFVAKLYLCRESAQRIASSLNFNPSKSRSLSQSHKVACSVRIFRSLVNQAAYTQANFIR